jgi:aspartate-semialdehyde dehydrogenase
MNEYNVFVVGATGLVGQTIIKVLEERKFPVKKLFPFASERSRNRKIKFNGEEIEVKPVEEADFSKADFSLFATDSIISSQYVPAAVDGGGYVVDNSSAFRQKNDVDIIVPEINSRLLRKERRLYANPNCSTAQLAVALNPLHEKFSLKRVTVSTYQAVSGSGLKGIEQLTVERNGIKPEESVYPHPIFENCLPQIGNFDEAGNCEEENKIIYELKKILGLRDLTVAVTTVRVPLLNCHSESVLAEFENEVNAEEAKQILSESENIVLQDNPDENIYPLSENSKDKDEVFIGRIRNVKGWNNALQLWIVADNLRKGAASNAVQIAEKIIELKLTVPYALFECEK